MTNSFRDSSHMNRRRFLSTIACAGAAAILRPGLGWAADAEANEVDPRVAGIVASSIGVDTHNHIDVPLTATEVPGPAIDLTGELKKSGLSAVCMTFAVDYQRASQPGEAYERFINGLNSMDKQLELSGIKRSLNLEDLVAAHQKQQPTVVQSVEGGHFLEGRLERVEEAYKRGLRHLGLLHDSDASMPLGDVYTNPPRFGGLTEFGKSVVKESNRLGILVDLAHATGDTVAAALKISTSPMMISHTGLDWRPGENRSFASMMKPRLISKEQAKVVADAGGVVGVWTHLADSPLAYAENLKALADVIGVDHVCIGTDTKLTPPNRGARGPGGPGGPNPNAVASTNAPAGGGPGSGNAGANAAPNAGRSRARMGERTNQAWAEQKVGFYYAVVNAMLKAGFAPEEIAKIGGGNFCRIFGAATSVHA